MAKLAKLFQLSHIRFLFDMFRSAIGGIEWYVIAYLVCIICFFIIGKAFLNLAFVYPLGFMMLTIFNPFLIVPLSQFIGLTSRIRRIFWLLPINLVLAYSAVVLSTRSSKMLVRPIVALCLGGLILISGTSAKPYLQTPENIYKTSNSILQISDFLEQDSRQTGLSKRVLYSSQSLLELRQYDPSIESLFRRSDLLDFSIPDTSEASVQAVIKSNHKLHILALVSQYCIHLDPELFINTARKCNVNYIIQETSSNMASYYESVGYEQIATIAQYEIFRTTDLA